MQNRDTSRAQGGTPGQPRSSQAHAADPWADRARPHDRSHDRSHNIADDGHGSDDVASAAKHAYSRIDEAGGEVRNHLERIAGDGRTRIAGELRTVGEAANAAAERLSDEDHNRIGGYVRGIRRQCDRAAEYLERHDTQSLISDVNHLARRNPALFVGGAAVLGLVAGRFLSARPPRQRHDDVDDYGDWAGRSAHERWPEAPGQYQAGPTSPARPGVGMGAATGQTSAGASPIGGTSGSPTGTPTGSPTGTQFGGTTGRPIGGAGPTEQRHTPGASPGGSMSDRND